MNSERIEGAPGSGHESGLGFAVHGNWPQASDAPFLESSVHSSTRIFMLPSEGAYALGYKEAADQLVGAFMSGADRFDHVVFPIVFLYRHHLELMLKQVGDVGLRLGVVRLADRERRDCSRSAHDLDDLWVLARRIIEKMWPESPSDDLDAAEHVIAEFARIDATSQSFRYSTDLRGREHLKGAPRTLDLETLKRVVDGVSCFLEAAATGIEEGDPDLA